MKLEFRKYQGTGNDFIMIDNRSGLVQLRIDQIVKLCHRKFGIGSDGIILIEKSSVNSFYMKFYNPDGSQSFCGNGSRCAVKFAGELGLVGSEGEFSAIDGNHEFELYTDEVKIRMRDVSAIEMDENNYIIHTGSPHYVIYSSDLENLNIIAEARKIRFSPRFKDSGINVNFVKSFGEGIQIRTYERGVEDETLSCGTGVTAAALSFAVQHPKIKSLIVSTLGGSLTVKFENIGQGKFSNIWLCGPAELVFKGETHIEE